MRTIHLAITIAALCAWMGPAAAQTAALDLSKPITLDQALDIAFKHNPNVKIAVDQINISRAASKEAAAAFLPTFNGTYRFVQEGPPIIATLPATPPESIVVLPAEQRTAIVSTMLPLDINGRITYTTRIARDQFQIDYLGMVHASEQLIFDVKSAYYNLLRAQAQADVDQEAVDVSAARLKNRHRSSTRAPFQNSTLPARKLIWRT